MDRRVKRTKDLIWNSFVRLILENGYENVSIKDIIEEANIGRSTFYSHYENKESLLFTGQLHLFKQIFKDNENDKNSNFVYMLEHAKNNSELSKVLFKAIGKTKIIDHMHGFVSQKISAIIDFKFEDNNLKKRYLLNSAIYSVSRLILDWIEDDNNFSTNDIQAIIDKNIKTILVD